jgi:hypothetical protein
MQGDALGIFWALAGGLGIAGLVAGIGAALTHDDPVRGDSLVWSVGVVGLGIYALRHQWVLTDTAFNYHLTRALWLGWMASNAVNVVLNLRGFFWRRAAAAADDIVSRTIPNIFPRAGVVRRQRVTFEEEIEERFINGQLDHGEMFQHYKLLMEIKGRRTRPSVSPDGTEDNGTAPQIVHVRQPDGTFVEVHLPDAVPVAGRVR